MLRPPTRAHHDCWVVDGPTVPYFRMPFPTRMTVLRLRGGALWVHSPIPCSDDLAEGLEALGPVRHLIAPNALHHLFLPEWRDRYPEALLWGTGEVIAKRDDLRFDGRLDEAVEAPWRDDVDVLLFRGSRVMEEAVFLHRATGTLLVADLIENFRPDTLNGWQRLVADAVGILAPRGRTPLDWRTTFLPGRRTARACLERMLAWEPRTLVMAHGEIVTHDVPGFLARSFRWLGAPAGPTAP